MTYRLFVPMPNPSGRPHDGTLLDVTKPQWASFRRYSPRPVMAFDSVRGVRDHGAHDDEPGNDDAVELLNLLHGILQDDTYLEAETLIRRIAGMDPNPGEATDRRRTARDTEEETPDEMAARHRREREAFDRRKARDGHRPGHAMDAAPRGFNARHPECARIRVLG